MKLKKELLIDAIVPEQVYVSFFKDEQVLASIDFLRLSEQAADELIEESTGYSIFLKQFYFETSPKEKITLPRAPLIEVVKVEAVDAEGNTETIQDFKVEDGEPAAVLIENAKQAEKIRVIFKAGYQSWAEIPAFFKQVLLKATSYFFLIREPFSDEKLYELADLRELLSFKKLFYCEDD
jgi:hypothetical protein